ncbi:TetR family transcriptional regulator [Kineococcus sp. T13]|uniref:TetR family transcriptional regulator n=1 Tax=Kineococcus vitellinus TaxID=2696565 RepID=UPI001411DECA|nr:TetR family transcriptional regulator [Kineococcus vitellinus]
MTVSSPDAPGRTTRRRAETRARLLAAARDVLAEQGLARSSVEGVCERAGFTRGAFYSNFATMDDVVAALFAQQAEALIDHVEQRLARAPRAQGAGVEEVVAHVLDLLPVDRHWHAVRTEYTAQALRNPAAAAVLAAQRARLRARLAPVLEQGLRDVGRRLTAPADEVARALVTVHEGTTTPRLLGDVPADDGFEARLLAGVLLALSAPDAAADATAGAAAGATAGGGSR